MLNIQNKEDKQIYNISRSIVFEYLTDEYIEKLKVLPQPNQVSIYTRTNLSENTKSYLTSLGYDVHDGLSKDEFRQKCVDKNMARIMINSFYGIN